MKVPIHLCEEEIVCTHTAYVGSYKVFNDKRRLTGTLGMQGKGRAHGGSARVEDGNGATTAVRPIDTRSAIRELDILKHAVKTIVDLYSCSAAIECKALEIELLVVILDTDGTTVKRQIIHQSPRSSFRLHNSFVPSREIRHVEYHIAQLTSLAYTPIEQVYLSAWGNICRINHNVLNGNVKVCCGALVWIFRKDHGGTREARCCFDYRRIKRVAYEDSVEIYLQG